MDCPKHLLLIDGHNLLFQMFFGMPSRIVNRKGEAVHGIIGFVGALNKLIARTHPTHVAVLFDGEHHNLRTDLNAAYKATRPDWSEMAQEATPFSQLPGIRAALDHMGIPHCEVSEGETDDAIAAYCLGATAETFITVVSWDSDFFQLISPKVQILRYRGDCTTLCDAPYLARTFDITPDLYADFKSLTGDKADNIQGACKVGPKTAAALLHQFGSLEGILSRTDEISRPALRCAILEAADRLRCNQQLIKLSDSAPLPFPMEALGYSGTPKRTTDILREIGVLP